MAKTKVIGATMPPALWESVLRVADEERRSRSQMLSLLVEEALIARGKFTPHRPAVAS